MRVITVSVACSLQALSQFAKKPLKNYLFGPENAGKSCLVETLCINRTDIFIVKLITIGCGFQFFDFPDQNMCVIKSDNTNSIRNTGRILS